jgi:phosphatidylglycerol:prolipoprotein diacylglycerol transferase
MTLLGCVAGAGIAHYEIKRRGEDPSHVWNILALGVVLGLIGARLYHVIHRWSEYYSQNPGEIIAIWHGGQGIYGAIVGALLALFIYVRWKKLNLAMYADVGVIGFLLGQAIGRWGNFFNQEIFGPPTDLPWGIAIDFAKVQQHAPLEYAEQYTSGLRFHPLFLYESLLSFLGVAVLLYVSRRLKDWLRPGDVALMYGIWYPTERFFLEFLRIDDPWKIAGVATAQWVSGAIVLACAMVIWWRHRKPRAIVPEEPASEVAVPQGDVEADVQADVSLQSPPELPTDEQGRSSTE